THRPQARCDHSARVHSHCRQDPTWRTEPAESKATKPIGRDPIAERQRCAAVDPRRYEAWALPILVSWKEFSRTLCVIGKAGLLLLRSWSWSSFSQCSALSWCRKFWRTSTRPALRGRKAIFGPS